MILEKQSEGVVLEEGVVAESTTMEIDAESHIFLMRMLSKFYSDAIGSLIRETASNALDSHRHAGVTEPIVVSLKAVKGNHEFSVEDFGSGIDTHIVDTVIRKYGKSTKRGDAKALGAFGLGFKSPLAYSPSFCFVGRKDGIERKWMMYEAEDENNKIDLLYETPTTERNGVKVIVPVKYYDTNNFINKIKEQLCYFEHVYFDVQGIDNDFSIVRQKNIQYSPLCNNRQLHVCLDNVYYPIDYAKLGIPVINYKAGLRFSLSDGLYPLPNRETLKYTEEAKKVIKDRIKLIADEAVTEYNDSVTDKDDVKTVFASLNSGSKTVKGLDGNTWDIHDLIQYSSIKIKKPRLNCVKVGDISRIYTMRDHLAQRFKNCYRFSNGRFVNNEDKGWDRYLNYHELTYGQTIYIFTDTISKVKKDYLRDTLKGKSAVFVKFAGDYPLKSKKPADNSYTTILNLKAYKKNQWREVIKEFQHIRSLVTKDFIDLDKLEIPKEWFEARKKERVRIMTEKGTNVRRKKLSGEVTGREARDLERYVSGKNCKFESLTIQMKDAHKDKKMTIYGNQDIDTKVQKYFEVFKESKVRFMLFSERELKNLKELDLHNWITMEEFEKGKHIIFKRAVTAYLIKELMMKYAAVFTRVNIIDKISVSLGTKLATLAKYKSDFHVRGDEGLYKEMVAVAEDKNLFDPDMYPLYKEIVKTLDKLPFLNPVCNVVPYSTGTDTDKLISALKDLFKYYKMRIDWIHYKVVLNADPVEELKEEEIEEIV